MWNQENTQVGDNFISNRSPFNSENIGFAKTVSYKIVYCVNPEGESFHKYGICSFLTDGYVNWMGENIDSVLDFLNKDSYRKLTIEETKRLLDGKV